MTTLLSAQPGTFGIGGIVTFSALAVDSLSPSAMCTMTNPEPIRLIIVDDHEMLRRTLRLLLLQYDDLILVGEAADGQEALQLCDRAHPDIVLMDIHMPQMDGIAATRAIRAAYPGTHIIGMSGYYTHEKEIAALAAGASACIDKQDLTARLVPTIRDALHELAA